MSFARQQIYVMILNMTRHDNFDDYTRRQYMAKGPAKNPFGDEETPKKFTEFDVFTKLQVLVQLSQWTLINAERMRQNLSEVSDSEQLQWVWTPSFFPLHGLTIHL